jgi:hypothetical protein
LVRRTRTVRKERTGVRRRGTVGKRRRGQCLVEQELWESEGEDSSKENKNCGKAKERTGVRRTRTVGKRGRGQWLEK